MSASPPLLPMEIDDKSSSTWSIVASYSLSLETPGSAPNTNATDASVFRMFLTSKFPFALSFRCNLFACCKSPLRLLLQLLEHVVTSSHTRSHFLRHVNGLAQTTHILLGIFSFLIPFGMAVSAIARNVCVLALGALRTDWCNSGWIRGPRASKKLHAPNAGMIDEINIFS